MGLGGSKNSAPLEFDKSMYYDSIKPKNCFTHENRTGGHNQLYYWYYTEALFFWHSSHYYTDVPLFYLIFISWNHSVVCMILSVLFFIHILLERRKHYLMLVIINITNAGGKWVLFWRVPQGELHGMCNLLCQWVCCWVHFG